MSAFTGHPVGCFIAAADHILVGFCCVDCTFRGFTGPIGVEPKWRGCGIGRALLVNALRAMKTLGYGYSIIGNVASPEFFEKAVGAVLIRVAKPDLYPPKLVTP